MSEVKEMINLTKTQHFSHDHPLKLIELEKNGNEEVDCSGCGDPIEGSSYCCIDCKFYLHKTCVHLPLTINHAFHEHTLNLEIKPPYRSKTLTYCDICYDTKGFLYHCFSCHFILDVKCALSPQLIAGDFSLICIIPSHSHPMAFIDQKHNNQVKILACGACEEPTSGPIYSCLHCKFYLHKKCLELPPEITHPSHNKHPLTLLTSPPVHHEGCSCYLCKNPCEGFFYHCAICEFGIKIKHVFSSQSENGTHQHPFFLLSKPISFICDACGTDGDCISYICTECNLAVHKECIKLPHVIKIPRHVHPISHVYSLQNKENKLWECRICYNEVKTDFGSYYCSECSYIVHVSCVRERNWLILEVTKDAVNQEIMGIDIPNNESVSSAEDVTDTEIKHFDHEHNLTLNEELIDETYCDGCMGTISGPFYFCKLCNFFLHKSCAKLPMKTHFWFSTSQYLLQKYTIFRCAFCGFLISGFSYMSERKTRVYCLRCCAMPDIIVHEGHEHPIFFDVNYEGKCNACRYDMEGGYRCKNNDFALHYQCLSLPLTTRHKSDEHLLKLTYHDHVDYPSQHYCDICEEERDSACWFYSCEDCNFTAHPKCTLGEYHFINQGVPLPTLLDCHPHRLFSVKKVYYYPPCKEYNKPCLDLAFECKESGCDYITHCDCCSGWLLDA